MTDLFDPSGFLPPDPPAIQSGRFATALNCIDGRAQAPLIEWVKLHSGADYVDLITYPGADRALPSGHRETIEEIRWKVFLSRRVHNPKVIAVAAHYDCLANPVSREEHLDLIRESVGVIASWGLAVRIVGAWVNEWNSVELVCDTKEWKSLHYQR